MAHRLAETLRALRRQGLGRPITQNSLGRIIGASAPLISAWENGLATPSDERLEAYALFFAGPRSLEKGRLVAVDDLSPGEAERRRSLLSELTGLAAESAQEPERADGDPDVLDFWTFPAGEAIRIICGVMGGDLPPYADPAHRNFLALSALADLDSLVELYGHLRARNPASSVRIVPSTELDADDLHCHLVLLGNIARAQAVISALIPATFPVRQDEVPDVTDGEVFVVDTGEPDAAVIGPTLVPRGDTEELVEDVGFLARMSSPLDRRRTLTICSGVFARGVYGAVRCTTDDEVAAANTAYLRERFAGADPFGVLMRVLVAGRFTPSPRFADESARLFEFP
jgi:transcriptional regulator with XRE-family HTH domain